MNLRGVYTRFFGRRKRQTKLTLDMHPVAPPRRWFSFASSRSDRRGVAILDLQRQFRRRYHQELTALAVLLVVALFFTIPGVLTRASVVDFYPRVCLGGWDRSERAQGKPESWGAAVDSITEEVSATIGSSTNSIFCGQFVPPDFEASSVTAIESVGLTLVWHVGVLPAAPPPAGELNAASALPAVASSTATSSEVTGAPSSAPGEPEPPPLPLTPPAPGLSTPVGEGTVPEGTPAPPSAQTRPTSEPVTPPPSEGSSSGARTLKWFAGFVARVRAEDTPPSTSTPRTVEVLPASPLPTAETTVPPPAPELAPTREPPEVPWSSSVTTVTSSALEVATSSFSSHDVVPPPPEPDLHFLKVSYSIDGRTWFEVGKVNPMNWENFTVTLPVTNVQDLTRLQVTIEPIPTTVEPFPQVHLDGMILEVHYARSVSIVDFTKEEKASSTREVALPQLPRTVPSAEPLLDAEFAAPGSQSCSLEPFSVSVTRGGTANQTIRRVPSAPGAPFQLLAGKLPHGIEATFTPSFGVGDTLTTVSFAADASAVPGSYSIVIAYRELSSDGAVTTATCQANLIVE